MEALKVEFYADEVFVFTPAGDIKQFPSGATALDFAYAIHSDVGAHCTGAKVSGRMVPLRYELQSGDTLEILTSPHQRPSRDWLSIARTGRAVSKIRRFLRQEERELGLRLGQEMLESELKRVGWSVQRVLREGTLQDLMEKRGYEDVQALYIDIVRGQIGLQTVLRHAIPQEAESATSTLTSLFTRWRTRTESPVLISGEDGVLVSFAKCCGPLPGEPVTGFITRGRGITVHRTSCAQLKTMDAERRIPVEWEDGSEQRHSGEIQIVCEDRPGLLANISQVCEKAGVNISRAEAHALEDGHAVCTLEVSVRDVDELRRVIKSLQKIRGVASVNRLQ